MNPVLPNMQRTQFTHIPAHGTKGINGHRNVYGTGSSDSRKWFSEFTLFYTLVTRTAIMRKSTIRRLKIVHINQDGPSYARIDACIKLSTIKHHGDPFVK